jgi:hypothetical protein
MRRFLKVRAPQELTKLTGELYISATPVKQCSTCSSFLPLHSFFESKISLDGFRPQCKSCFYEKTNRNKPQQKKPLTEIQKLNAKARYLERKVAQRMLEINQRKNLHMVQYPDIPFYSSEELYLADDLVKARGIRRKVKQLKRDRVEYSDQNSQLV